MASLSDLETDCCAQVLAERIREYLSQYIPADSHEYVLAKLESLVSGMYANALDNGGLTIERLTTYDYDRTLENIARQTV